MATDFEKLVENAYDGLKSSEAAFKQWGGAPLPEHLRGEDNYPLRFRMCWDAAVRAAVQVIRHSIAFHPEKVFTNSIDKDAREIGQWAAAMIEADVNLWMRGEPPVDASVRCEKPYLPAGSAGEAAHSIIAAMGYLGDGSILDKQGMVATLHEGLKAVYRLAEELSYVATERDAARQQVSSQTTDEYNQNVNMKERDRRIHAMLTEADIASTVDGKPVVLEDRVKIAVEQRDEAAEKADRNSKAYLRDVDKLLTDLDVKIESFGGGLFSLVCNKINRLAEQRDEAKAKFKEDSVNAVYNQRELCHQLLTEAGVQDAKLPLQNRVQGLIGQRDGLENKLAECHDLLGSECVSINFSSINRSLDSCNIPIADSDHQPNNVAERVKILAEQYGELMEHHNRATAATFSEKKTRVKYQDIVYKLCSFVDSITGRHVSRGTGTTVDTVLGVLDEAWQTLRRGRTEHIDRDLLSIALAEMIDRHRRESILHFVFWAAPGECVKCGRCCVPGGCSCR